MDPNEIVAARLKAIRRALKIKSQSEFARMLGIEKNTYNPFEKAKRPLTFETACLIRRKFGVPVDWLFFGDLGHVSRDLLIEATEDSYRNPVRNPIEPKRKVRAAR